MPLIYKGVSQLKRNILRLKAKRESIYRPTKDVSVFNYYNIWVIACQIDCIQKYFTKVFKKYKDRVFLKDFNIIKCCYYCMAYTEG